MTVSLPICLSQIVQPITFGTVWDFDETWHRYSVHGPDAQNTTSASSVKGQGHGQGRMSVWCPVHNFAVTDGILMELVTNILLMDLMCRTQLSAMSLKGQGHNQGQISHWCLVHNFVETDGILMKLGTHILTDLMFRTQLSAVLVKGQCHSQPQMLQWCLVHNFIAITDGICNN